MAAGDYWFEALSNVGKNIGAGIKQYHQRHDELDQVDSTVKMFSQFGVSEDGQLTRAGKFTEESGKAYAVQPIIPPEMLAEWSQYSGREKMRNIGAIESLLKFQQHAAEQAARAKFETRKEQTMLEREEALATFKQGLKTEKPIKAESQFSSELSKFGLTPDDFSNIDTDSLKFTDDNGEEVEDQSMAKFVSGTAGDKQFEIPKSKWRQIANMSKGEKSSSESAPGSRQIPVVKTAADAWKLPPGTLFKTPDGRYLRVPMRRPNNG